MIHVIATVQLSSGARDRFLSEFAQLAPQVRAETGCIEYGAAVDVASGAAAQGPVRPDVVTIIEKWTSLDALTAHLGIAHMKAYRERVKPFVQSVVLQVLAPAGGPAA